MRLFTTITAAIAVIAAAVPALATPVLTGDSFSSDTVRLYGRAGAYLSDAQPAQPFDWHDHDSHTFAVVKRGWASVPTFKKPLGQEVQQIPGKGNTGVTQQKQEEPNRLPANTDKANSQATTATNIGYTDGAPLTRYRM